ncbi:MAG: CvpA family protein [Proteobacteria bacterium]|nr:CvpA family protein [Pseudomonadota bacterium]MBU1387377.1 CvpA family protein [Pseudomonadota bacterium]MBU1541662.1 CvpA family protein [Pseudomonadota bacterium]MBU2481085.1 CvpA family protein [Pseudomonadota bacterium]
MNTFDIVIVVITSFCLIRGFFKGLIGEVSGIVGVFAGFYGAYAYYPMIAVYVGKWIQSPPMRDLSSFFLLFCLIIIGISLVSILIRNFLKLVFLGWVDRTFGLIFGAAKGLLIVSVLLVMITSFLPKNTNILTGSKLSPHVAKVATSLSIFVSKNTRSDFLKQIKGLI